MPAPLRGAEGGSAARATSTRSTAAGRSAANRHLVVYAFARDERPAGRPGAARPVGVAEGRRRRRAQPGEARAAGAVRGARARACPAGMDVVVIARPGCAPSTSSRARLRRAWATRLARAGRARAAGEPHAPEAGGVRAVLIAPIRVYQRAISPLIRRRCKYHPTCSAYAVDAIREFGAVARPRAGRLAPAALQPVEPRGRGLRRATSGCSGREPPRAPRGSASRAPRLPPRERQPHLRVVDRRPDGDRAAWPAAAGDQAVLLDAAMQMSRPS